MVCMFGITYTENIYEIWNTFLTHTDFNIFRAHWMLCTHKSTLHCAQISTWSTQWDIIVQDKDGHSALDRINFHTVTVGSTRTQLKMIWLSPLLLLTDVENFKNLSFIEKPILYMSIWFWPSTDSFFFLPMTRSMTFSTSARSSLHLSALRPVFEKLVQNSGWTHQWVHIIQDCADIRYLNITIGSDCRSAE